VGTVGDLHQACVAVAQLAQCFQGLFVLGEATVLASDVFRAEEDAYGGASSRSFDGAARTPLIEMPGCRRHGPEILRTLEGPPVREHRSDGEASDGELLLAGKVFLNVFDHGLETGHVVVLKALGVRPRLARVKDPARLQFPLVRPDEGDDHDVGAPLKRLAEVERQVEVVALGAREMDDHRPFAFVRPLARQQHERLHGMGRRLDADAAVHGHRSPHGEPLAGSHPFGVKVRCLAREPPNLVCILPLDRPGRELAQKLDALRISAEFESPPQVALHAFRVFEADRKKCELVEAPTDISVDRLAPLCHRGIFGLGVIAQGGRATLEGSDTKLVCLVGPRALQGFEGLGPGALRDGDSGEGEPLSPDALPQSGLPLESTRNLLFCGLSADRTAKAESEEGSDASHGFEFLFEVGSVYRGRLSFMYRIGALLLLLALSGVAQIEPPPRTHYAGRRIARTMSYHGAPWLLRRAREREEATSLLLENLGVKPGMTVCDLGCGNGYLTLPLAKMVGESGRVLAVDIQPEMLEMLEVRAKKEGLADRIDKILCTSTDPRLPKGKIDLLLMVDVYHEVTHPQLLLRAIRRSLTPAGRVAFVEFRREDQKVPIKHLHKMSARQVVREAAANGLVLAERFDGLPWQHLLAFSRDDAWKPAPAPAKPRPVASGRTELAHGQVVTRTGGLSLCDARIHPAQGIASGGNPPDGLLLHESKTRAHVVRAPTSGPILGLRTSYDALGPDAAEVFVEASVSKEQDGPVMLRVPITLPGGEDPALHFLGRSRPGGGVAKSGALRWVAPRDGTALAIGPERKNWVMAPLADFAWTWPFAWTVRSGKAYLLMWERTASGEAFAPAPRRTEAGGFSVELILNQRVAKPGQPFAFRFRLEAFPFESDEQVLRRYERWSDERVNP